MHHAVSQPGLTSDFLKSSMRTAAPTVVVPDKSNRSKDYSFGIGKLTNSLSPSPVPGPWWDCASDCLSTAGLARSNSSVRGNVRLGIVRFARSFRLHVTAFNFARLLRRYANPCMGPVLLVRFMPTHQALRYRVFFQVRALECAVRSVVRTTKKRAAFVRRRLHVANRDDTTTAVSH